MDLMDGPVQLPPDEFFYGKKSWLRNARGLVNEGVTVQPVPSVLSRQNNKSAVMDLHNAAFALGDNLESCFNWLLGLSRFQKSAISECWVPLFKAELKGSSFE